MEIAEQTNVSQLPAVRKPADVRVVEDVIPILDTARFEHMQRIALAMAGCSLIPESLMMGKDDDGKPCYLSDKQIVANCFLVVNQAVSWNMDPFAVAQCVSVINGRLMHEGKLIAAVIEQKLGIKLHKEWSGAGEQMSIVVSNPKDATERVSGSVAEWKTTRSGSPWFPKQYQKMLWYRGVREWCRMYAPGLILGIYSPDEDWDDAAAPIEPPTPPDPPAIEVQIEAAQEKKLEAANPTEVIDTKPVDPSSPPGADALGGKPGDDPQAIPPGLRRAKKAETAPAFKIDAWLKTLANECADKTPAQLLDLREKMMDPLRDRLGADGFARAEKVWDVAREAALKKYGVASDADQWFDADQWIRDLGGALSGCTDAAQVFAVVEKVQKPALEKVSREHYARGKKLVAEALVRIAGED